MIENFQDIPAFVAAVEMGGFSAAARRLNLSRSTVGKAVARLEDRLGVRLFQRTTRSQSLTDDGQAFYERCQRALTELRAGRAQLESGRKAATGRLRVSMPVLFGRLCVAPILTRLAAKHPELTLELNFHDRYVDLINDGFDLAVRNGPLSENAGLVATRISRQRTIVCASPSYIEKYGQPRRLADLSQHSAVTYARNGRLFTWRFPGSGDAFDEITPPSRLCFDDLGAIVDAAVAGFGLTWMPEWMVHSRLRSGELVRVLLKAPTLVNDIYAIWPQAAHLPMRVRVAIDALTAELQHTEP